MPPPKTARPAPKPAPLPPPEPEPELKDSLDPAQRFLYSLAEVYQHHPTLGTEAQYFLASFDPVEETSSDSAPAGDPPSAK